MQHHVCLVCGYNMVNQHPEKCPFCGADRESFITAQECTERYRVSTTTVNNKVTRLNSVPALGIEHAAYRIETGTSVVWVDCPSTYDPTLDPPDVITFTHHHFLGASTLYRSEGGARVRINERDTKNSLVHGYAFDEMMDGDFELEGIRAHFINGHTWGFTFYIFEDVLLTCDYVFLKGDSVKLNPFGDGQATIEGARKLCSIIDSEDLTTVCGYNYVTPYGPWREKLDQLLTV